MERGKILIHEHVVNEAKGNWVFLQMGKFPFKHKKRVTWLLCIWENNENKSKLLMLSVMPSHFLQAQQSLLIPSSYQPKSISLLSNIFLHKISHRETTYLILQTFTFDTFGARLQLWSLMWVVICVRVAQWNIFYRCSICKSAVIGIQFRKSFLIANLKSCRVENLLTSHFQALELKKHTRTCYYSK